jgi:PII-like signaling protein
MHGYQITFFTQQDRRQEGRPLADWLVETARALGVRGATALAGSEGFGHSRRIHSARFFELADQPVEVTMVASVEETERLFAHLSQHGVHVFYARTPVEFGTTGEDGT